LISSLEVEEVQDIFNLAVGGDLDSMVEKLNGHDITSIVDSSENSLLHLACFHNHTHIVKYLLEGGKLSI